MHGAVTIQSGDRPVLEECYGLDAMLGGVAPADLDLVGVGPVNWEAEFESGWAAFVEVGYRWESNWRLELEGGWRQNDVDCISFGGPCIPGNWGDVSQFTQMVNIIHDIDISPRTALSIGVGFGGNFVDVDSPFPLRDDDDFAIAGQGIPNGSITSTGRGETELLVQTADGVKEPQNRRATIDLN